MRNLWLAALFGVIVCSTALAQQPKDNYIIKDGKMLIELSKRLSESALDSFITKFDLYDLDLKNFMKTNSEDSLRKLGWKLEKNDRDKLIISKLLRGFDKFSNPAEKIMFAEKKGNPGELFPVINSDIKYGYNSFRRKSPFLILNATVRFFFRSNTHARKVMLAGSFNNWDPQALSMRPTDSGWIADVKLGPGKYWYKFIVDGSWTVDKDNARIENDGRGNNNSVFFMPNTMFRLPGYENADKVYLAGSFNNWRPRELAMVKTATGWELPIYLADGTHTYRFVADGKWMTDPQNKRRLPNEFNDFNSVIEVGEPLVFRLNGYNDAKQVKLTGSFNKWREDELFMDRTPQGWQLSYTLGPGNHEYHYIVDGKWVMPEGGVPSSDKKRGNAQLVIGANYKFRLKGFTTANSVKLAGDFNNWSPDAYLMSKEKDGWSIPIHLSPGKHQYKFIVDGKWIMDPANNHWEQNEFGTGNSVIWFDPFQ